MYFIHQSPFTHSRHWLASWIPICTQLSSITWRAPKQQCLALPRWCPPSSGSSGTTGKSCTQACPKVKCIPADVCIAINVLMVKLSSYTGTPATVKRLQDMVPNLGVFKVNLGRWRPDPTTSPDCQFPALASLQKASFWTLDQYKTTRLLLTRPPIDTVQESVGGDIEQVRVGSNGARIQCWSGQGAVPRTSSSLPFRAVVFNLIGLKSDAVESLAVLPCRGMVMDLPVLVIGAIKPVDMVLELLDKEMGREWGGTKRVIDIFMDGKDDPTWFWSRRRCCLLMPPAIKCPKVCNKNATRRVLICTYLSQVPPYFNFGH